MTVYRRRWWALWLPRRVVVCWVCERRLDPGEARAAEVRWGWIRDGLREQSAARDERARGAS
ncbi:hypothetical protein ACIODS_12520 [Micromonospora chalcea]|uniref:hypothetical protein n=1 Tax=Micromonospora chalcea TaxID=1874 RepID=UPI00381ED41E